MSEPKQDEPGVRRILISDSLYVMVSGKGYMLEAVTAESMRKHFKAQHIHMSDFAADNGIGADTASRQFKDGSPQMEFLQHLQKTLSGVGGQLVIVMPPVPKRVEKVVEKVVRKVNQPEKVVKKRVVVLVRRAKKKKRKSRKMTRAQVKEKQMAYKLAHNQKRLALGLSPKYKMPKIVAGIDLDELASKAAKAAGTSK